MDRASATTSGTQNRRITSLKILGVTIAGDLNMFTQIDQIFQESRQTSGSPSNITWTIYKIKYAQKDYYKMNLITDYRLAILTLGE